MSLKDRLLASNAPAWIYEQKGDMLLGEVVNRSTRSGGEYADYEIITVLPDEAPTVNGSELFTVRIDGDELPYVSGPLAWHAMGTVAKKRVEEQDPQVGDHIGILFDGEKVGQSGPGKGKKYDVIQVVVERSARQAAPAPAVVVPAAESFTATADDFGDEDEPF